MTPGMTHLHRGWARQLVMFATEPIAAPQEFMCGSELSDWFLDRLTIECAISLLPDEPRAVVLAYGACRSAYSTEWQVIQAIADATHLTYSRVRDDLDRALDFVADQCGGRDAVRGFDRYLALHC